MILTVNPLVFVHLPKTAGTSFRMSLERVFGVDKICMDYGVEYEGSSPCVLGWFESRDLYEFYEAFMRAKYRILAGHFAANKYINLFSAQSTVTFLREPVKRVLSEYSHFKRHHGYKGTLDEFYRWDRNKNMQARMLMNVPRQALGLVGVTERYGDSLALFASRFGLKIPNVLENTDPDKVADTVEITEEQRGEIELCNQKDCSLYRTALRDFELQIEMMRSGKAYTFSSLRVDEKNRLDGWAFQRENDTPVPLHFTLNGTDFRTIVAKDYRGLLHRFGCPRRGHLGFNFELPKLKKEDILECKVIGTGQKLFIEGLRL